MLYWDGCNDSKQDLSWNCYQPCGQVLSCFNCHHKGYLNDPMFWNLELRASGIGTLVPCHLMVAITHTKQGISRFHLLVPYLGRSFHWLTLNDRVPRQLSYGVVVPELYGKKVYNDSTRKTSGWNCYTDILLVYVKLNKRNELCIC